MVKGVSAAHGSRVLFSELDLVVAAGDIIGLVGPNGAGKSTLLRILAGIDVAEAGTRSVSPPDASIGLMPQETVRRAGETVDGFLRRRTGVAAAQSSLDNAALALAAADPDADEAYSSAFDRWLALGSADFDERVAQVAAEIGLDVPLELEMTALSGGQVARCGLASMLLSRFDVILLDEPTNDLDLAGLEQLEQFVLRTRVGVVLVSHDREFLARTVTKVLELDMHQRSVNLFGGGYDSYVDEREHARRQARDRYDEYAGTVSKLTDRARTQRDWADTGVRNARRKATDRDKIGKNFKAETSEKQAAKARQTDRMVERLDVVEEPRKEWALQMSIIAGPSSGSVVAVLNRAEVHRGSFVLGPVTLQLDRGDRVAVLGANGSGKSTLVSALLGRLVFHAGGGSLGSGVTVGEIDQARGTFLGDETLAVAFGAACRELTDPEVRTLLAKFGLGAEHVHRTAATLSAGERTRAALALLQARGVNLLVLDEPTNHLDVAAIEQLEQALDAYDGTLLDISHDRRLLSALRTTRTWIVDGGQVTEPT